MSIHFGGIRQLGMVVRDAEASMREWAKLGVGPFFTMTFEMDDFMYRGKLSSAPVVTLCFAHSGPLQIELIQQHNDVPSAYTEFLASGREGAQHVCAWFSDHASYDVRRRNALERGMQIVHEGGLRVADARFCYFETGVPGALMMEISEALLGANGAAILKMEAAARDWDGRTVVAERLSFLD